MDKKHELHRRDFLKVSTASTATAFGAFALAGNQVAMAYSDDSSAGSATGAKAPSMTEEEIAALPRVRSWSHRPSPPRTSRSRPAGRRWSKSP